MKKSSGIILGAVLILFGALALSGNFSAILFEWDSLFWGPWRFWPLAVIGIGLLMVVPPLVMPARRGLGGLLIPGLPVLTTGGILLFTSLFDAWEAWGWLWPLEVISLGLAFLLAAYFMRVIWLLIPAFLIGANGLLFLFCSITGLWEVWAALWTLSPLSLGLAFLVIYSRRKKKGLLISGLILTGLAAVGLIGMSALVRGSMIINLLGPAVLVFVGLVILMSTLQKKPATLIESAEE